ncbi:MAG TPA: hypothetical protein VMR44_10795 [Thermoanaerobaculia bacterium]|nr:hypothetical protein [Thermoanaerobaculia bacterium]
MAVPQGDFSKLLRDLRAAGPVDRVRLLAKSLAALRGLSPWDRKVLLRMAGFEGAEALVERLAQEDEETGRRLRRLLKQLEGRPEEMERTVRALADPERRGEALDELLKALDQGLGSEEEAVPPAPPPELPATPVAERSVPAGQKPPKRRRPERPSPRPSPRPAPQPPKPASARPGAPEPEAAGPPAPPEASPAPPSPAAPWAERAREVEPVRPEAPARSRPEPGPGESVPEDLRRQAVRSEALSEPPTHLGSRSASAVLTILRELRRRIAGGESPDASELRRTLETEIPFPWARRRALVAWLAAGPPDLEQALALIEELPSPADRFWCLGALADAGRWSEPEWQRIEVAAPTAAARRRLERRRRV